MNRSTPTADAINKVLKNLNCEYVDLVNESMNHAGYFEGKESHFKLTIVSHDFDKKRLVARHQMIYTVVDPLLTANGGTIHALAIHAYTPIEWQAQTSSPDSPLCAGKNN